MFSEEELQVMFDALTEYRGSHQHTSEKEDMLIDLESKLISMRDGI